MHFDDPPDVNCRVVILVGGGPSDSACTMASPSSKHGAGQLIVVKGYRIGEFKTAWLTDYDRFLAQQ